MVADGKDRLRALVTGASSGIGAAFAERLARDGYDLTIGARRGDRLSALASRLQERYKVQVEAFVADLSNSGGLRSVEGRFRVRYAILTRNGPKRVPDSAISALSRNQLATYA